GEVSLNSVAISGSYIYKKGTKKNTLCRIIGITNNETEININYFEEDTTYILTLVAAYKDYSEISREDTVTFTTGKKSPVGEVYTDVDFASLKPGTKFTLYTNTTGAKIMYSLDGKDPATYGSMYTEPITISSDVTLKAVAIKENMENSITSTFEITVADKTPVVYLSPSNQKSNPGVKSVGYTNEMEMMNKVADVVERVLKASGVTVYRNDPNDNMKTWLTESRNVKSDLHLAIHSNGSVNHDQEGMEIYVHEETSPAYSVAQTIYNDLFYLYQSDGHTVGRGVLFARGRMGEVHPLNIKMGVLIEIAYHDNASDAKWIVDNIDQIGTTIANSILKYFQVN
ncbi:MAG TPA: N-acetylmuramoyl-L-alanine amidase, partial [Bacilli bacterium]|nr:N-acetylmuramoyl-L-alanine amidase [Bacilli bacterium]